MGGGRGTGLNFGATYGSGQLPLVLSTTLPAPEAGATTPIETVASSPTRDTLMSMATTDKVRSLINELYREGASIGNGSTADAVRHELATGENVGGKSHIKKAKERLKQIEKILKKNPEHPDRAVLEMIQADLKDALGGNN